MTTTEPIDFKGYLSTTLDFEKNLHYFIDAYYTNDTNYLRDLLLLHANDLSRSIIILCDVNNSKNVDEEFWTMLFLAKNVNDNYVGLISYSKNKCPKNNIENFKTFLHDVLRNKLELFENLVDFASNDFISTLSNTQHIYQLDFDFDKLKQHKLLFNHKHVFKLDQYVIEKFFGNASQQNLTFSKILEKILISFKRICTNVRTFRLENLNKLTVYLNKINLAPKPYDKKDLRIEILNIIEKLVENGQIYDDRNSNIEKFFKNNKNHYIESMKSYRDNWLNDEKTVRNIEYFKVAAKLRLEFLTLMGRLAKNELKFDFLDEFMEFFVPIEDLDKHRNKLLDKFTPKDVEVIINRERALWRVCDELQFNDLLELMGTQVESNQSYKFHENTFNKAILTTAKSHINSNEKSSVSIIKLILMHLKKITKKLDTEVENVLEKLLKNIPQNSENDKDLIEHIDAILGINNQHVDLNKILVCYLAGLLTDNENDLVRQRSFEILKHNKNLLSVESNVIFESELLIKEKLWNYDTFLEQIKKGSKINISFFSVLDFQQEKTKEFILQINQRNFQKIPKNFIKRYLEYIKCSDSKSEHLIEIASVLIQNGHVTLADILVLLSSHDFNKETILNLIYIAYNYGETIPNEILRRLESIPKKSIFIKNLIKLIAKKDYTVSNDNLVLKKSINQIYKEFEIKLIYENDLTKRVQYFDDLMSILKDYTKVNVDATNILKSLFNSSIDIKKLNNFLNRIESYDESIYVNMILKKINEDTDNINVYLEILESLLKSENLRQHILNFLSNYLLLVDNDQIKVKVNSLLAKESTLFLYKNDQNDLNSLLNELNKFIENQQFIPMHVLDILLSFYDKNDSHIDETLTNFIFKLDQHQGLGENILKKLFAIIDKKLKLLNLNGTISILINALLTQKHDVSIKVIEEVWKILKEKNYKERLVDLIKGLIACEIFNDELEQKAIEFLKNDNELEILRIVSLQFIVFNSSRKKHKELVKFLKDLSISKDFHLLSQLAFCSLRRFDSIDNFEPNFLVNYSNKLGQIQAYELMEIFVVNQCQKSKYLFLYYLTNSIMMNHPIDLSIFSKQCETEWEKEVLCNEIVFNNITNQQVPNKFELMKFRENISQLDEILAELNEFSIEKLLDVLILKQIVYGLTFSQINDLLAILKFDKHLIKQIFLDDFNGFFMKGMWIQNSLKKIKVNWNDNDREFSRFYEKLKVYNVSTIINMFRKIEILNEKSIKDYIDLLETFENSVLSIDEIEEFLNYRIGNLVTLGGIKRKFESIYCELVVEKYLSNFKITNSQLLISFKKKLKTLNDSKWSLFSLIEIMKTIKTEERLNLVYDCLEIVYEYGLTENDTDIKGERLFDILVNENIKNAEAVVHSQAIFSFFKGSYRKSFDELLNELITLNKQNELENIDDFIMNKI